MIGPYYQHLTALLESPTWEQVNGDKKLEQRTFFFLFFYIQYTFGFQNIFITFVTHEIHIIELKSQLLNEQITVAEL